MTQDELSESEWRAAIEAQEAQKVVIPVVGGLCELAFTPGGSCGTDPDCQPGISFHFLSETGRLYRGNDGRFYGGTGVFGRSHALALRDMIDRFLAEHPPILGFGDR